MDSGSQGAVTESSESHDRMIVNNEQTNIMMHILGFIYPPLTMAYNSLFTNLFTGGQNGSFKY